LVLGLGVWGWLWWKTRGLRKQMRAQMAQMQETMASPPGAAGVPRGQPRAPNDGMTIEGDFIHEAPPREPEQR
jgi:hypothetical protein